MCLFIRGTFGPMRAAFPNMLTLGNLLCGVFGLMFCLQTRIEWAGVLVFVAMIFDFLDGMVARLLNVKSEMGKQLDSLADMVSFGVLPGMIFFQLISISRGTFFMPLAERPAMEWIIPSAGWLITCFAALRLARFNIDVSQADYFIGLPTPAVAAVSASIPLILGWQLNYNFYQPLRPETVALMTDFQRWDQFDLTVLHLLQTDISLIFLALVLSGLMVAHLPIMSLKFKNFGWKDNRWRYVFLSLAALTLLLAMWNYIYLTSWLPFVEWVAIPLVITELLAVSVLKQWVDGNH